MGETVSGLFEQLQKQLKVQGEKLVESFKEVVSFKIDDTVWTLDLRDGNGSLFKGEPEGKPALTIIASEENFVLLVMGKLSPQQAFMAGKIQVKGSIALALKLQSILALAKPAAKM